MKNRNLFLGLILSGLAACNGDPAQVTPPPTTNPISVQTVADGNTALAADLFSQLREERDGNIFISPASISTAFGLAYAGARGQAESEISNVLHFAPEQAAFHSILGALSQTLQVEGEGQKLRINNAVWLDKSLIVEADWTALTHNAYAAEDTRADFRNAPDASREAINRWVEDKTEDKIKDLLAPSHVDGSTRAVLVNTIYMDADWAAPFTATATQDEPFYLLGGTSADTKMMNQTASFRHLDGPDYQALELPYQGEDLSMVIVLPKANDGISDLEKSMTAKQIGDWIGGLDEAAPIRVELKLPKLKLKDKYELAVPLQRMGLSAPFSGDPANFAGMVDPAKQPDGSGVTIDKVVHQTFLEVDEKGTEAAAATAITMRKTAAMPPPPPPPVPFHADHPFLLLIKHNETGTVLFLGRITDPRP